MYSRKTDIARPSLVRTLMNAVRAWWRHDDIRLSPYEGRLLRLNVPCMVEVDGELFEITRRTIGQSVEGKYVAYHGTATANDSECELVCRPGHRVVQWRDARATQSIEERLIGVFCANDRRLKR